MNDFVLNLSRTYTATATIIVDEGKEKHTLRIPCVFNIKPVDKLTEELEAFSKEKANATKVASSSLPILWVALESVDLSAIKVMDSDGKTLPKSLYKDAAILDPQLSAGIYKEYARTISGNVPAAT